MLLVEILDGLRSPDPATRELSAARCTDWPRDWTACQAKTLAEALVRALDTERDYRVVEGILYALGSFTTERASTTSLVEPLRTLHASTRADEFRCLLPDYWEDIFPKWKEHHDKLGLKHARAIAAAYVADISSRTRPMRFVIDDSLTWSGDFGWVFFWDAEQFFETGNYQHAAAGTVPLLVLRDTFELVTLSADEKTMVSLRRELEARGLASALDSFVAD